VAEEEEHQEEQKEAEKEEKKEDEKTHSLAEKEKRNKKEWSRTTKKVSRFRSRRCYRLWFPKKKKLVKSGWGKGDWRMNRSHVLSNLKAMGEEIIKMSECEDSMEAEIDEIDQKWSMNPSKWGSQRQKWMERERKKENSSYQVAELNSMLSSAIEANRFQ